jgi:hypothetical protein
MPPKFPATNDKTRNAEYVEPPPDPSGGSAEREDKRAK